MINQQTLKLPHEITDPNQRLPSGTTYADIERSIVNAVHACWAQLSPLRRKLSNKPDKMVEWEGGMPNDFKGAMKMLEVIYLLLDRADALNENLITQEMDMEEEYDDDLEADDGDLPAPIHKADVKAVGKVEAENP